jgi:hypothetical protein
VATIDASTQQQHQLTIVKATYGSSFPSLNDAQSIDVAPQVKAMVSGDGLSLLCPKTADLRAAFAIDPAPYQQKLLRVWYELGGVVGEARVLELDGHPQADLKIGAQFSVAERSKNELNLPLTKPVPLPKAAEPAAPAAKEAVASPASVIDAAAGKRLSAMIEQARGGGVGGGGAGDSSGDLASVSSAKIRILTASYGANCDGANLDNQLEAAAVHCDGKPHCSLALPLKSELKGELPDPAPNCAKGAAVRYCCQCGTGGDGEPPVIASADLEAEASGQSAVLSCDSVDGGGGGGGGGAGGAAGVLSPHALTLLRATYGPARGVWKGVDVTDLIGAMVSSTDGRLQIPRTLNTRLVFGDPSPGSAKQLKLHFVVDGAMYVA